MSISTHKLVLAVCLLAISFTANAGDRNNEGGWRLGYGHDNYGIYRWDGRNWRRMPGSATDVGDGWVIGTDRRRGGYGIYRWNGRDWSRVSGGAVRIGGTYAQPWVINNQGERYYWNGYDWEQSWGGGRRYEDSYRDRGKRNRW